MNAGHQPGSLTVALIIVQQHLSRLFVECGFWVRIDKETFNDGENVGYPVCGFPVLLEGADADVACRGDVGVKDLCREHACHREIKGEIEVSKWRDGEKREGVHFGGAAGNSSPKVNRTLK
jgi:hypothetical protein